MDIPLLTIVFIATHHLLRRFSSVLVELMLFCILLSHSPLIVICILCSRTPLLCRFCSAWMYRRRYAPGHLPNGSHAYANLSIITSKKNFHSNRTSRTLSDISRHSFCDYRAAAIETGIAFLTKGSARVPPVPTVKLEDRIG